jgi:aminoglycoside phosphotransferase (APT) family kinase protein
VCSGFLPLWLHPELTIPELSPKERFLHWQAATQTLAKLHRLDFNELGLQTFGKPSGFYNRQIATWSRVHPSQARAVDADSKIPVGPVPHFDKTAAYLAKDQPPDRATIVHGDYKIDNMVFHKTEPRVIGVLDWEMSTIGHPLSDLCGLLAPYFGTASARYAQSHAEFVPGEGTGLPSWDQCMRWYSEITEWDPRPDMDWAIAFSTFRASVLCQGIAMRVAQRQATSEQARAYGESFVPLGELAWQLVQERAKEKGITLDDGSKLWTGRASWERNPCTGKQAMYTVMTVR